jgi:hypothetical protein
MEHMLLHVSHGVEIISGRIKQHESGQGRPSF